MDCKVFQVILLTEGMTRLFVFRGWTHGQENTRPRERSSAADANVFLAIGNREVFVLSRVYGHLEDGK